MYLEILVVTVTALFIIGLSWSIFKDSKSSCTICKYQPNGYYWIDNKQYCESCFKAIRESKLTEEETNYKILMHIQESRKKTIGQLPPDKSGGL